MNRDYMISYDLTGNYRSTINENIVIGFSTTSPSGFLLGLIGLTNEYMTVEVSNSGKHQLCNLFQSPLFLFR